VLVARRRRLITRAKMPNTRLLTWAATENSQQGGDVVDIGGHAIVIESTSPHWMVLHGPPAKTVTKSAMSVVSGRGNRG
jgi:hypothetical protein